MNLSVIDLSQMRSDIPGGHGLGIQRDDCLIKTREPALMLGHDLRFERARTIPGYIQGDLPDLGRHRLRCCPITGIAQVLAHRVVLVIAQMGSHLSL